MASQNLLNAVARALLTPSALPVTAEALQKQIDAAVKSNDQSTLAELFDLKARVTKLQESRKDSD